MASKTDQTRGGRAVKRTPTRRSRTKAEATNRLAAADRALAKGLSVREVDAIVKGSEDAVVLIETKSPQVSAVTGEPLAARELALARKKNLLRAFGERRNLLAGALTVSEVAKMLGVGRQTPHDRVKAGRLLAVRDNGKLFFPEWQFDADQSDGVVAGFPDVLREMRGPISPLAKVKWFLTPKSLMAGRAPIEALRAGDVDSVVAEARAIGAS
jgi:excisionase family DNA binding protein